jgi:hypothetical protein
VPSEPCNIRHAFGDQRCIRPAGHEGNCRSRVYPNHRDGTLTWSEWRSEGGQYRSHVAYHTTYPHNANRDHVEH